MSVKRVSSGRDENRDLRKQIGCMNGIFQLFDRHHFLMGRRISSHSHKRLPQGAHNQMDPKYAMKVVTEVQKEKPRTSTESSRASYSSSSCSSTFSSLDCNKMLQPETVSVRQINIPESVFQTTSRKERQPSLSKSMQSLDLRDVVKDSMYREARGLPIKSRGNDERRGTVMKHIDSPRPTQQFKGSTQVLAKNSKDDRLALPRFSYDGRESRETFKSSMKLKELPRLSLDSKASSMKCSALEYIENEPGSHRTSSVVAKLMGLQAFPDTVLAEESRIKPGHKEASVSQLSSKAEERKQNQVTYLDSPRNFVHKQNTSLRFPIEPAPWRQQEPSQGSPKVAAPQSRKAPINTAGLSSSVYGEIEKRITDLEFKRSGKDLRALKQILEAMQKTREQLEDKRGESAGFTIQRKTDQNPNSSTWKNKKSGQQAPTIKGPCSPKQLGCSAANVKPAKVMDRAKPTVSREVGEMEISHLQRPDARNPRYHREISARGQKAKDLTQKNKKTTWGTSERSFGMASPRLQQNPLRLEGQSCPTTPFRAGPKKHCNKKVVEKGSQNRKHKVKLQLGDDQLSEISSDTRYSSYQGDTASVKSESNNSIVSQAETEVIRLAHSIKTNAGRKENSVSTRREHIPVVDNSVTMLEQPSPISVLDDSFYSEDSPSPIKKKSTAFRDMSASPDEAEWNLENLNNIRDCTRSSHGCKYNQKLENMESPVHELRLLNEPDGTAANHTALVYSSLNPDHRYINKVLLTSGLLKDSSFISTTDQLLSSRHLINPDMFHILEQTEEIEKNDRAKLNKKIQRKIIFDMVDEILVRKITSGRLFPVGNKGTSPQGLLKEVYLEMDRVCSTPDCNLDDEGYKVTRHLTADMMYQSEEWANYSGEVPALVLDIERLIFKDLINEVVTGEFMGLHDLPKRHCRQLFRK